MYLHFTGCLINEKFCFCVFACSFELNLLSREEKEFYFSLINMKTEKKFSGVE